MEQARLLAEMKREIVQSMTASAAPGNSVQASRRAASAFYAFAEKAYNCSKSTTSQLVAIYERFGESRLRPQLESLFGIGELAALKAKSDEVVEAAIAIKEVNPDMTRSELLARIAQG